jgi:tetratricopeptide (TPR) repeat protein
MPLSKPEVLRLLQKGVRQDRVVEVVKELGIDFSVTAEVLSELTAAGAGAALIAELMALRRDEGPPLDRPPAAAAAPGPAPVAHGPVAPSPAPAPSPAAGAVAAAPIARTEPASAVVPPPEPPAVPPDPPPRMAPPPVAMPAIPAPPPVPPPPAPAVAASIPSPPAASSVAEPAPPRSTEGASATPLGPTEAERREQVRPLLDRAQALANDGDLRGAQEAVGRALEIDPGAPEVWRVFKGIEHDVLVRAEGYLGDGQVRRALREFQTIVTRNPESAPGHAGVGLALIQLKSYDEAVVALERALQLDPGNARYRQTLTRARDFLKASKAFERTGQENLQRMLGDQPGKKREP